MARLRPPVARLNPPAPTRTPTKANSPISSTPGLFWHPHTRKRVYEQLYARSFLILFYFILLSKRVYEVHAFSTFIYLFIYSYEMRVRAIVHVHAFPTFFIFKFFIY